MSALVALNPALLVVVKTSLEMLQVAILMVLIKQLLAQLQTDCNSPHGIIIMQDPQGYVVSQQQSMSMFVVTGTFIEPLVFPSISLQLRQAPNSSKLISSMHALCNGDAFVEPGVMLTSCFSKELQPDAVAFEEEICLRWLHPVGEFGAEERSSVAKRMVFGTFFDTVPVLKKSKCRPVDCERRVNSSLTLTFDELSAAFHRSDIDKRDVSLFDVFDWPM